MNETNRGLNSCELPSKKGLVPFIWRTIPSSFTSSKHAWPSFLLNRLKTVRIPWYVRFSKLINALEEWSKFIVFTGTRLPVLAKQTIFDISFIERKNKMCWPIRFVQLNKTIFSPFLINLIDNIIFIDFPSYFLVPYVRRRLKNIFLCFSRAKRFEEIFQKGKKWPID